MPVLFKQRCPGKEFRNFVEPAWINKEKLVAKMKPQFDFLNVQEGDTIVDLGAQSGWYAAAFSVATGLQKLSFVLVDIDSACLNQNKLQMLLAHYSKMQDSPITNTFKIVVNTPDSLWLPANTYNKVLLMNTLHEIPDALAFIKDIHFVMHEGGEVIVQEMAPTKPRHLHGGCKKPLMTLTAMQDLFSEAGFRYIEKKNLIVVRGKTRNHIVRFKKM